MVKVTISPAAKPPAIARALPLMVNVASNVTVADVKTEIVRHFPKFKTTRQRIARKSDRKPLDDKTMLSEAFDNSSEPWELQVKDLGPQFGYRFVFIVEYLGPLIIHPLFYHFPKLFYGEDVQHSKLQKYAYAFVMLHFIKRELETLFVHRFSHATMPLVYLVRNAAHYYIPPGLLLAFDVYRGKFSTTSPYIVGTIRDNEHFLWACTGIWLFAEVSNFHTHLALRALRPEGSGTRKIPYGYGFDWVSTPNYFFEIMVWVLITAMTGSLASCLFLVIAIWIMGRWAGQKHRKYKKEFGKEYPSNRTAMIPFIY